MSQKQKFPLAVSELETALAFSGVGTADQLSSQYGSASLSSSPAMQQGSLFQTLPENRKNKKPRGGRATGSQNFTEGDRRRALSVIQWVKPFRANKWEQVSNEYNIISWSEKWKERDRDFLKKYYTDKVWEGLSKPTGDPQLSWELHEVKLIRQEIDGLLQMGSIEDNYDSGENEDKDDQEIDMLGDTGEGNSSLSAIVGEDEYLLEVQCEQEEPPYTRNKAHYWEEGEKRSTQLPGIPEKSPKVRMSIEHHTHQQPTTAINANHLLSQMVTAIEKDTGKRDSDFEAIQVMRVALEKCKARYDRLESWYDHLEQRSYQLEDENRSL
ncbi:hypothetical protein L873DRAFT_1847475 [Choiromyces venosus 120613-1]|uniref:DUF6818 domain-containing protein n=1 Tax=Choiromyces venosus 120613-1 TaxID=1336337 RepID=A0A3N4J987_9PEZI|nr:hypothetical protein L873DRAFT_1847475 [Choiromyces venosus 120613-1]